MEPSLRARDSPCSSQSAKRPSGSLPPALSDVSPPCALRQPGAWEAKRKKHPGWLSQDVPGAPEYLCGDPRHQTPDAALTAETHKVQAPVSAPIPDICRSNKVQKCPRAQLARAGSVGSTLSAPPGRVRVLDSGTGSSQAAEGNRDGLRVFLWP